MKKVLLIAAGLVVTLLLWAWISYYPNWLWFEALRYSSVFWTLLLSKFGLGILIWLIVMVLIVLNIYVAIRLTSKGQPAVRLESGDGVRPLISSQILNPTLIVGILFASFMFASKGADYWDLVLRFFHQSPFGETDPIFHKDIGFYVFSLPFYVMLQKGLLFAFILAAVASIYIYVKNGTLQVTGMTVPAEGKPPTLPEFSIQPAVQKHLIFLGAVIALIFAWDYYLKTYHILYSTRGAVFGAGYTDVNIRILSFKALAIVSIGFALMLFFNVSKPRMKILLVSGGSWIGAVLILSLVVPFLVQKFVVKPNELKRELSYIKNNIDFTRNAYNLNRIIEGTLDVTDQLTAEDIAAHKTTIQNIRIWDERPLLQTYRQIQSIRLYYNFNDVDVDRYQINNQYRQIMLSARELVVDQLPAQAKTWVNRHLIYTHGYGLAASLVNEVTPEGLPRLLIKDLPPAFDVDLKIDRPEIYYGEKTDDYVLVKTKTQEFDYPKGEKNVYADYQGSGGVLIKSFMNRLLFAIEFMDPQILFTGYLGPESRIMFNRRIDQRVNVIAPFLDYDSDPYIVVSEGKLYWMIDAYTTSNMYPYSRRVYYQSKKKTINYIRNSVKVTVDAYNGDVSFYVVDEKDPVVKTYAKIFPDLFKPLEQMPADLKKHVRYPKDLFKIQADTYKTYHMTDPQVFYNQEDLWQTPDELYGDNREEMQPYYIIVKLPKAEKEEFLLMLPFTPSKKDNMIGWLAARSDLPNYGNLLVYKLSKEKLVFGPMQIEARVDQQTEISRELSLWGQRGSRVIRGNLLVIPIGNSFIYVEPIYLEAKQEETSQGASSSQPSGGLGKLRPQPAGDSSRSQHSQTAALPELKRVIAAFGNRVVMEETLDLALKAIFNQEISVERPAAPKASGDLTVLPLGRQALEHYNKARDLLREGRWAEYGQEIEQLENILKKMAVTAKGN
ncbi:MAG: UPF0182 family protein [Desulfobacterales bacterium]|nr:UPF0182 family protein [Desulfobacterales bacterium]